MTESSADLEAGLEVADWTNLHSRKKLHAELLTHLSMTIDEESALLPDSHCKKRELHKRLLDGSWYDEQLQARPVWTKSWTAALLVGGGDTLRQLWMVWTTDSTNQLVQMDWYQVWVFTAMGMVLQAPVAHYYYHALDTYLPPTPHPWTLTTLIKLGIDQLAFAPCFLMMLFVFLDLCNGVSGSALGQHLQKDYFGTLVTNWKLWLPASFVNLAFCPPRFRVLYNNVVFFVWSIILSILLNPNATQDLNNSSTEDAMSSSDESW